MTYTEFDGGDWIERLAETLPALAEAQEPYLQDYWRHHPRTFTIIDGRDMTPFPLDDVRMLYERSRYSRRFGEEAYYAPLRAALDTVRHSLLGHPMLERVAVTGRVIGDNDFWMEILNSGSSISAGDLIAGLLARAAELPGDRFRTAAHELNAFLSPVGDRGAAEVLGELDEGCDALLFYGLTVAERAEIADSMEILPLGQARRFVDMDLVEKFAPSNACFQDWRPVGALIRPFRWRPVFHRRGNVNEPTTDPTGSFFQDALLFLDLLAVCHAAPVAPLAMLSGRIDRSANLLLGWESQSPGFYRSWPVQGFEGLAECPVLEPTALEQARWAFGNRETMNFAKMAPFVGRLATVLARNGRFAGDARVLEVGVALEGMYELPEGKLSRELRKRVSEFLGTDPDDRERIRDSVKAFYDARSNIAHSRQGRMTPFTSGAAFVTGFDLAQQSLLKLLRDGRPEYWDRLPVVDDWSAGYPDSRAAVPELNN
ncbi:MAG: hypothetical protein OXH50_10165 [Gemmatimonadetes bacterium]|nr:hypothetical protein [Gemmatimonadota bacterium]